jgi:hypothetical protein
MRFLLALALFLAPLTLLPPIVHARAVSIVQTNAFTGNADDNSLIVSSTAGNVLIVLGHIVHASQGLTISDTAGSSWSTCPALRGRSGPGSPQVAFWWTVTPSSGTVITLTSVGGSANTGGYILEASGMGTPTCDETGTDETAAGTSHGGAISVTPSTTRETIIAGSVVSSSAATFNGLPGGYTTFTGTPTVNTWAGYKIVTSIAANTFVSGSNANEDTLSTVMALMTEAPAGGCTGSRRSLMGLGRC